MAIFAEDSDPTMFAQVNYPEQLLVRQLDQYLERGWFRMGQTIFTTNFLHFKHEFYSAIWLRVDLKRYTEDKVAARLMKQNARFRISIQKASLDVAKEELFAKYRQVKTFEASPSLYHLLYGKSFHNIFNTYEICLFDSDRLIAAGFFDIGKSSAAGITSFYDPAYKKNSLGKFLITLKMAHCKQAGLDFFYPGYFVPGYPFFDYKLQLGNAALQYLEMKSGQWLDIASFTKSPYDIMREKLIELQTALSGDGVETRLFKYEFFDANLFPELKDAELFDYPVFLNCFAFDEQMVNPMIVYDVLDDQYRLVQCRSIWTSNLPSTEDGVYSYHLLKIDEELISTIDGKELSQMLRKSVWFKSEKL